MLDEACFVLYNKQAGVKLFCLIRCFDLIDYPADLARISDMDKLGYKLLLFDVYGSLLTDKQQQALAMTYNEDYSLTEIAAMLGISRQAVFDAVRRAEELLQSYDDKLGLVQRAAVERSCCEQLVLAEEQADWRQVAEVRQRLSQLFAAEQ